MWVDAEGALGQIHNDHQWCEDATTTKDHGRMKELVKNGRLYHTP